MVRWRVRACVSGPGILARSRRRHGSLECFGRRRARRRPDQPARRAPYHRFLRDRSAIITSTAGDVGRTGGITPIHAFTSIGTVACPNTKQGNPGNGVVRWPPVRALAATGERAGYLVLERADRARSARWKVAQAALTRVALGRTRSVSRQAALGFIVAYAAHRAFYRHLTEGIP